MKSKVLISLIIAIWSTGALANNDWGENFSWSVECDEGASYYTHGPDRIWIYGEDKQNEDGTPLYPLLGVYISLANNATFAEAYLEWEDANGNIQKDNLEILDRGRIRGASSFIGERGCLWLGNDKCTLVYDDEFNVPCVKMHKNCKNTVVIKSTTREIVPTTIHFNYSIINGHPLDYYADGENYLASLSKSFVVKAHRTFYDEVESFSYEDPLLFFCDLDSVFTEVLDWDYDDNEHDTSGLVYELTFEIDGGDYNTNTKATFSPNAIYGPGEYNVDVSNVFSEEDAIYCWNTNFQFDLDGGGTIEYTLDGEQVPFSVNGEGLQGRCHESYFPIGITPKIIPNPGKVLESVTALYDSGISNEIEEESIPFTFNEEGGYYEIGNLAYSQETMFSAEDGVLWLGPGWMNTIKVRFKDADIIVKAKDYTRVYGEENPAFEYTVEDGELTGTPVITCDATPESPVGTYDIVISKGSVENNNVVFEKGTLTIEKAPLTIEAGEYEINQGDALPEFEPNYIGFKNGEMFNVLTRLPVFTCPYIPSDGQPGTYTISVDGAEADNYEMTYVDGTLRVKEAPAPNNTLSSETVEIRTGGDGHISLELNNEDSIIMVEFYMQLPEGISLAKDEDGYWDATLNTNRSNRHSLEVEKNSEGLYHFLVYSTRNNALKGNDGELININIVCDENMEAGIYQATLRNILFNDIDKKEIVLPDYTFSLDVKDVLLGDVNGDWKINGSDIVLMVDHIMGRPSDSFIIAAAELTGDGQINGSDLVEEISLVMSQSISTNATPGTSNAPRYLATGLTMDAGSNGEAVLGVTHSGSFILAQMMLQLSEGQQLTDITTDSRHHVEYRQLADDRYFVLCYSGNNDEFISKDEMLTFHVTGEGSVSVSEAMLVDADRQECYFAPVSTGQTTLIERVTYSLSQPADIYSVSGAMVRKQATSLKGLAKGVYFINGNKIIID